MILWCAAMNNEYSSNGWATFKQIQAKGWKLRKGSKGQTIIFYSPIQDRNNPDKIIPMMRGYYVFNADCIEGYEMPEKVTPADAFNGADIIDAITAKHNITLRHEGTRAFYAPGPDTVTMPVKAAFASENNYIHVALHEFAHWTGHKSRLARIEYGARFGDEAYAFEELCAELSAAFSMATLGLGESQMEHHASYLQSWIKALKNDRTFIFKAASKAQTATTYLLGAVETDDAE